MNTDLHKLTTKELGRLFPIVISEPQPEWPELFAREKRVIRELLGSKSARRIAHVGSTAVPGLVAKPAIDILVTIPAGAAVKEKIILTMTANGYEHMQAQAGHIMVVKGYTPEGFKGQAYHVHLGPADQKELSDMRRFRDVLRSDAAVAGDYAALKKRLAVRHRYDREAYTEAKTAFIHQALAMA